MNEENRASEAKIASIPDAELDVMRAIWSIGEPTVVGEIHRVMQKERKCTKPAVHILVDRLEQKGFLKIERVEKPVAYKLVTPLVSEKEYAAQAARGLIGRLFHGSWEKLIASLADSGEIGASDVGQIEKILGAAEKK